MTQPFIKCAGNKRKLAPQLVEWAPKHARIYVEPFCGSAAMFLALADAGRIDRAWLNDHNKTLAWTLSAARDTPFALINATNEHLVQHSSDYYYAVRAQNLDFTPDNELAIAARFLYLNRTCFNGLYRENSSGQFNVPIGKYKDPQVPVQNLLDTHHALHKYAGMITSVDFLKFFETMKGVIQPDCFIYFDPPYAKLDKQQSFTKYTKNDFTPIDQARLATLFHDLTRHGIPCMLSNSDSKLIRNLYGGYDYRIETVQMSRSINSDRNGRGKINELVIMNY